MATATNQQTLKQRLAALAPPDKYVVWAMLGLAAIGVVAVYSAVSFLADTKSGGDTERFLLRHLSRVGVAVVAGAVFSVIDYRKLARLSRIALIVSLGLLIAVQVAGEEVFGAQRRIFGFQPSDVAKVALVLYIAVLLTRKQEYIKSFSRAFAPMLVWILATVILIGLEDLSTAVIVLAATLTMCFVGRVSIVHLGALGMAGLLLAGALLMASPGRAARIESFLGVKIFPHTSEEHVFSNQAEGYQAQQARIAIAMGGLTGVGPGKSGQRDFLPAPYNDFIFAIIAEEYGLVGAVSLLGLFVLVLFRGFLRIARHAPDPLGLFLAVGIVTMLVLYGFVHAGVSCGLLPVTGLPMPLVSYGGTSMLAAGILFGILLNISRQAG